MDARRSILRPAMIETLVHQRLVDPDEWHSRIPQYLRIGSNAAEKNRFLDEICEIIERIREPAGPRPGGRTMGAQLPHRRSRLLILHWRHPRPRRLLMPSRTRQGRPSGARALLRWRVLRHSEGDGCPCDRRGRPDLRGRPGRPYCEGARNAAFGQPDQTPRHYASACGRFEDRRGRTHGGLAVEQNAGAIYGFRKDDAGVRGHEDVPLKELAAIAVPFIRLRMDDESVLRKMAELFDLGRLREATRARFEEALRIARQFVNSPPRPI